MIWKLFLSYLSYLELLFHMSPVFDNARSWRITGEEYYLWERALSTIPVILVSSILLSYLAEASVVIVYMAVDLGV